MPSVSVSTDTREIDGKPVLEAGEELTGNVNVSGLDPGEDYFLRVFKEFDNPDAKRSVTGFDIKEGVQNVSKTFTDKFNYSEDVEYTTEIYDGGETSGPFKSWSDANSGNIFPLNEIAERGKDFIDPGSTDSTDSGSSSSSQTSGVVQKIKDNKGKAAAAVAVGAFALLQR